MAASGQTQDQRRAEARLEASIRIQGIGEVLCPGQPVKAKLECVAQAFGWDYGRCRHIWYQKVDARAWELDLLRDYRPDY